MLKPTACQFFFLYNILARCSSYKSNQQAITNMYLYKTNLLPKTKEDKYNVLVMACLKECRVEQLGNSSSGSEFHVWISSWRKSFGMQLYDTYSRAAAIDECCDEEFFLYSNDSQQGHHFLHAWCSQHH